MRIIVDTNVVMSAIFFAGTPSRILRAWHEGSVKFVVSPEILQEYFRVAEELSKKYKGIEVTDLLKMVAANSELCSAAPLESTVCNDPDDDMFLACAVSARVKVVVSGDKGLRAASGFRDIVVMSPREFSFRYLAP